MIGRVALLVTFKKAKPKPQSLSRSHIRDLPAIKKMKNIITILLLIISQLSFGQTEEHKEKFRQLEPDIWLSIWDKENSSKSIQIDTLSYDDIPKTLDFRGTVVEALKWTDSNGENILIQTVTGHFTWKDYDKDSTDYMIQDKSELYASEREDFEPNATICSLSVI